MNIFSRTISILSGFGVEYLHYHVIGLNESSTYDDIKKSYSKLARLSRPDKNKHPQASAVMRMIN